MKIFTILLLIVSVCYADDTLPHARPLTNRTFERTTARMDRGRYLTEGILQCFMCHSERDYTLPGWPPKKGMKGAGSVMRDLPDYRMVAPNLTPDRTTGAGTWTDDMFARAIREGVGHDGRDLYPQMWYDAFKDLSDEDLASVVVYLRALPAVYHPLPKRKLTTDQEKTTLRLPHPITEPVPQPDLSTPLKRGNYLMRIADCQGCHTAFEAPANPGFFAGGNEVRFGKYTAFSANITPDPSGIPYYNPELFIETMRTGKVRARELSGIMPWIVFRNLNDEDLKAIFTQIQALYPIHHEVSNTDPPTYCELCKQKHGLGEFNHKKEMRVASVDPKIFSNYIGTYHCADGYEYVIFTENNKLYFRDDDGSKVELTPRSEIDYTFRNYTTPITFVRDSKGKVTGLLEHTLWDPAKKIK